jgi:hypothetical protein
VIYIVLRSRSPAVTPGIIDPHLLVYRQPQAAYYPEFVVQDEPGITLACAARCWQRGDGAPGVSGWVISELRTWRSSAAYHVNLTIEQHTYLVALVSWHGRSGSVAVRTRVIDENCVGGSREWRGVTGDDVHHAVKRCRRYTAACSRHSRPTTPAIGCGVINLHCIKRTSGRDTVISTRHIDVSAN